MFKQHLQHSGLHLDDLPRLQRSPLTCRSECSTVGERDLQKRYKTLTAVTTWRSFNIIQNPKTDAFFFFFFVKELQKDELFEMDPAAGTPTFP